MDLIKHFNDWNRRDYVTELTGDIFRHFISSIIMYLTDIDNYSCLPTGYLTQRIGKKWDEPYGRYGI